MKKIFILSLSFIFIFAILSCSSKKSSKASKGAITDKDTAIKKVKTIQGKEFEKYSAIKSGCDKGKTKDAFIEGFSSSPHVSISKDLKDKISDDVADAFGISKEWSADQIVALCEQNDKNLAGILIKSNKEVLQVIAAYCIEAGNKNASITNEDIATRLISGNNNFTNISKENIIEALGKNGYSDPKTGCDNNPELETVKQGKGMADAADGTTPDCTGGCPNP
ncbi:MAG: hypothetical protein ABIA04_02785 [Pseudomonadota bacterium]